MVIISIPLVKYKRCIRLCSIIKKQVHKATIYLLQSTNQERKINNDDQHHYQQKEQSPLIFVQHHYQQKEQSPLIFVQNILLYVQMVVKLCQTFTNTNVVRVELVHSNTKVLELVQSNISVLELVHSNTSVFIL